MTKPDNKKLPEVKDSSPDRSDKMIELVGRPTTLPKAVESDAEGEQRSSEPKVIESLAGLPEASM